MSAKSSRQIPRVVEFAAGGLVSLCAIAFLCLFVFVHKPYIEVTEVRATSKPQAVRVSWYLGCEEDYYEDVDKQRYLPWVPIGGEPPVLGPVMKPGTGFMFVGYPYTALYRNRFTGKVETRRSERFDVIEWHVVPPNEPAGWKSAEAPAKFTALLERRGRTC